MPGRPGDFAHAMIAGGIAEIDVAARPNTWNFPSVKLGPLWQSMQPWAMMTPRRAAPFPAARSCRRAGSGHRARSWDSSVRSNAASALVILPKSMLPPFSGNAAANIVWYGIGWPARFFNSPVFPPCPFRWDDRHDRHQHLGFQLVLPGIGPGQGIEIAHIGQRHHIAPAGHAADAGMGGVALGEGAMLLMAGRAGGGAVQREVGVVEQPPAQLHLGGGHRIVGRHRRRRNARRQVPLPGGLRRRRRCDRQRRRDEAAANRITAPILESMTSMAGSGLA